MEIGLRDRFTGLWNTYFEHADLPVTFWITGDPGSVRKAPVPSGWRCIVCDLARVRKGHSLVIGPEAISCPGGKYYCGYETERFPNFRYFISTGKEGVIGGERYKRTPEIVDQWDKYSIQIPVGDRWYVFKRWDQLEEADTPEVVIFYARPEVLSGLYTLANFDQVDPEGGVFCPFGSGCSSIITYPWLEQQKEHPRAVLGMFDPSARPCVTLDVLSIAIPMKKFEQMIGYMEESFLITADWEKVRKKIRRSAEQAAE